VIIVAAIAVAFFLTRKKEMSVEPSRSGDGHEWSMGEEPVDRGLFADDDDAQVFAGVFDDNPIPLTGRLTE
jgi:hypothetical protein